MISYNSGWCKRNFETRTSKETKRLTENLVSNNIIKNMDMHKMKSTVIDGDKIVEFKAKLGLCI